MRKIISKERGEKIRRGGKTLMRTCKHAGTRGLQGGSKCTKEHYKIEKYTFDQNKEPNIILFSYFAESHFKQDIFRSFCLIHWLLFTYNI